MQSGNLPASPISRGMPQLYSTVAVQVFALVFNPLFGGVLAYQNLKDLGRAAQARHLLYHCFLLALALLAVRAFFNNVMANLWLNLSGCYWLGRRYQGVAPEAAGHPNKPIWKPLFFSLLVSLLILTFVWVMRNM